MKSPSFQMIRLGIGFIFLFIYNSLSAQTSMEVEGLITADTTWSADTVRVIDDVTVNDTVTLTILPGTRVEFQGWYKIEVNGELLAQGSEGDTIHFTKIDTLGLADQTHTNGKWRGIWLTPGASGNLSHCIIEFANPHYEYDNHTALDAYDADLTLTNSVIRNNYGNDGCIRLEEFGRIEIKDNLFLQNRGYRNAGAIGIRNNSDKIIEGNHFIKNRGLSGGAISVSYTGLKVIIRNNFISQNEAFGSGGGIGVSWDAGPQIIQNIIVNNTAFSGGGIKISNSCKVLINNTICNNYATYLGGGIKFNKSPLMDAANNILWGNRTSGDVNNNIDVMGGSAGTFRNCLLEGGDSSITGETVNIVLENILVEDPLFENPTTGSGFDYASLPVDWRIPDSSSCVNAGVRDYYAAEEHTSDFFGVDRVKYGFSDLGVHEFSQSIMDRNGTYETDQFWIADTIKIHDDVYVNGRTRIPPGTVIQFQSYNRIYFYDTIHATGTEDYPIQFTISDTSGFFDRDTTLGRWKSLEVFEDNSRFINCHFEYGGGIRIHVSDAILENCLFDHNISDEWYLINFFNSDKVTVRNCIVRNTDQYGGVPVVIGGQGLSNVNIEYNQIYNNNLGSLRFGALNLYICNNLIYNNDGGILLFSRGDHSYFFNNTLAHNSSGITFSGGSGIIANNIIYKCSQGITTGSDQYMGEVAVYNNLFDKEIPESDYTILEDNVIADPAFIDPTSWIGDHDNFISADYSVYSISPAINSGLNTIPGHSLPSVDIVGNNRIHGGLVDIGAFEHTGQEPVIVSQPIGGSLCEGESKLLSVSTAPEDSLLFQWQKDGLDLPGSDSAAFTIDTLELSDAGNYRCMVWNSFGTTYSDQVYLNVKAPVKILIQPESEYMPTDDPTRLTVNATGSAPIDYQWHKDGILLPEENFPELLISNPDSVDEGIYTCEVANSCGTITTSPIEIYLAPQICMVTVSETSGHNLIIWEKESKAPVMAYNVYRESSAAGIYDRLATISYDELSVFVDTMADPTVQAYLYKITAIDTAENETDADLCKPHKTIHLLVSTNPELNTTQLEWDRYYGFEYASYFILRSVDGSVFSQVHDMSSNLHSWTDPDPVEGELVYRIAVERPDPCYPTDGSKKAGTGPYNHSLSNLDDNRLQAGQLPPDTITLSNNSIEEENMPTMMIGKLFTEDEDSIDSHTYQFVPGDGDDDNISFTLLGDLLLASESFDYETKSQYSVRIRSTDQAGNYCEVPFIIQIIDIDETTGLQVISEGAIRAFPNPFSQSTTISLPNSKNNTYRMILTDLSGKVCRMVDGITTSEYVLKKGDLKEGLYFIELRGSKTYRGKIIIE